MLRQRGCDADGLASKSWEVFTEAGAPPIDAVINVCDQAAVETCPCWPGAPATAHWGCADPSRVEGDEAARRNAYRRTADLLAHRIEATLALPPERLDRTALQRDLRRIGMNETGATP